jgi:hypothetical protein
MRRNTDIEIPQVRIRMHILCESYARAETTERKSQILNDLELQLFHAADLLAWDMVEARNERLILDNAPGSQVPAGDTGGDPRTIAA